VHCHLASQRNVGASNVQREDEQWVENTDALILLDTILCEYHPRDFAIRVRDETILEPEPGQPTHFTLVIHKADSLRRLLEARSERELGELYIYDYFDIEGQIEAVMPLVEYLMRRTLNLPERLRLGKALGRLTNSANLRRKKYSFRHSRHSKESDSQAIRYHYDVSNDFYQLWLDRRMVYSPALYDGHDDDLETAQERNLDSICRMLQLRRGDRLLDIGCGWGALIIHAAKHYGARAVGITLSKMQAELAQERVRSASLEDRCRVLIKDYREIARNEVFDKVASIGMIEHVGTRFISKFFRKVNDALLPGGLFLLSGITQPLQMRVLGAAESFIHEYVFPDGELQPLSELVLQAEQAGFEIRFAESLREHYAHTLRDWVCRLEQNAEQAGKLVDDVTFRIWRLYMAGSAHRFASGSMDVHRLLLAKAG
jgi:cyclopropane-fatty-acyl-phospholipid synthase